MLTLLTQQDSYLAFSHRDAAQENRIHLIRAAKDALELAPVRARPQRSRDRNEIIDLVNSYHNQGLRPPLALADYLPLERPSHALRRTGAAFAMNGGFFLDFGALADQQLRKADHSPFYGDPVGWLRSAGRDSSLPFLRRPAVLIFENGDIDICNVDLSAGRVTIGAVVLDPLKRSTTGDYACYTADGNHDQEPTSDRTSLIIINNRIAGIATNGELSEGIAANSGFGIAVRKDRYRENTFRVGDTVQFILENVPPIKHVINAGPTLVRNGMPTDNRIWEEEDFGDHYHPRTLTRDLYAYRAARTGLFMDRSKQQLFCVVSEPVESGLGRGLTLAEFASAVMKISEALDLDIADGVYLDGGASSTMCRRTNGQVELMNCPSGISNPEVYGRKRGEENEVGIILYLSPRRSPLPLPL